jgi:hypothetical protein
MENNFDSWLIFFLTQSYIKLDDTEKYSWLTHIPIMMGD